MNQNEVLKAILNVKKHTINLKKNVNKATKESFNKNQIDEGSQFKGGDTQDFFSSKFSSFHEIKDQSRSKQLLAEDKGVVTSYRSKNSKYPQTTLSKINSKKLNKLSDTDDFDDESSKKFSFYLPKQELMEKPEKQKTKDSFYTPKVNASDIGVNHPLQNKRSIKKGVSKIDLQQQNRQAVNTYKKQVEELRTERDYLIDQLNNYKIALIKIRNKYLEQENIIEQEKNNKKLIVNLKQQLQAQRLKNSYIWEKLRKSQESIITIRKNLFSYYQKINLQQQSSNDYITTLEYQNNLLRTILKLSNVKISQAQQLNTKVNFELDPLPDIGKLNIFDAKQKINAKEYLAKKLEEIQAASKLNTKKEEKKVFTFNFGLPMSNTSDQRDIYQDQAYLKGIPKIPEKIN